MLYKRFVINAFSTKEREKNKESPPVVSYNNHRSRYIRIRIAPKMKAPMMMDPKTISRSIIIFYIVFFGETDNLLFYTI